MDIKENDGKFKNTGFRPLIWGFFFYKNNIFFYEDLKGEFPSPHSGILFLLADALGYDIVFKKFPSPYSGILFLFIDVLIVDSGTI